MVIRSDVFARLEKQFREQTIGLVSNGQGIGKTININKYTIAFDYGEATYKKVSDISVKAIIFNNSDFSLATGNSMGLKENELSIYLPVTSVFEDTATNHYDFTIDSVDYVLVRSEKYGVLQGLEGIARMAVIAPKNL